MNQLSLNFAILQRGYQSGRFSPTSVIAEIYRRARHSAGDHVWTYRLPHDQVHAAALRVEALAASGALLPLLGLPFGVKDNIDVAGLPTSAGCERFSYTASRTAAVVEKLQAAGAILVGKQNLDQFATGLVGIRSPAGYCRNSFDPRFIPGGSSSGSAVAVATGQASFSIGSDTGGSGRVPAALNNIIGLKPTPGLVSTYGFLYGNRSFDVAPVFALTADDASRVLDVLAGFDARDIYSARVDSWRGQSVPLDRVFRFGLPAERHLKFFGDGAAQAQFDQALNHLHALGGESIEIDFEPFLEASDLVFDSPLIAERWLTYGAAVAAYPQDVHPAVCQSLLAARKYSAADAFDALYRLEQLKQRAWRELAQVDVLVLPTCGTLYRCDEVENDPQRLNSNMGYYTYFANPLRLAAVSVPAGLRADGLPFGISLLGLPFSDSSLLQLAGRFHAAVGGNLGATGTSLSDAGRDPG